MTKSSKIQLNVHEAKTYLSRYLHKVEEGETIILCRNGLPVAQLIPLPVGKKKRRNIIGFGRGMGRVSHEFFDELTDEDFPGIGL